MQVENRRLQFIAEWGELYENIVLFWKSASDNLWELVNLKVFMLIHYYVIGYLLVMSTLDESWFLETSFDILIFISISEKVVPILEED